MGVPRVFQWIVKKYPNTFLKNSNTIPCSYMCFDINGLIHPCVRQSIIEKGKFVLEDVEKKVRDKILELLKISKPTKGILLCIDGVAPLAKMYQQRVRRYKTFYDKEIEKEMYQKHNIPYPFTWDTNAITPSTPFMKYMNSTFQNIVKELEVLYPSCKIYYSDSEQVGEGEHKIIEYLRHIQECKEDTYFIHGLDADLIFLSIGLEKDNIYLMREQKDTFGYLNITELKNKLFLEIQSICKFPLEQKNIEKDFMVLSYFLGNDFLPSVFSLDISELDQLLKTYSEVINKEKNYLVSFNDVSRDYLIQWNLLSKLCEKLSEYEYFSIKNKVKKYLSMKDSNEQFENPVDMDIFWKKHKSREDSLKLLEPGWKERFYQHYFHFPQNDWNKKNSMVISYLEGLQWNLNYYLKGIKNWMWNYPYHATPFFTDIYHYVSKKGISQIQTSVKNISQSTEIPSYIEQLLVVLPPQSNHLIPKEYQHLMYDIKLSNILDLYPIKYELDWFYKQKHWEFKPKLPDIEFHRIREAVFSIKKLVNTF